MIIILRIVFGLIAGIIGFAFFGGGLIGLIVGVVSFVVIMTRKFNDD